MSAQAAPEAAVALSGEAFTLLVVLFVLGMLLVVLLRARAKVKAGRRPQVRRDDDGDGGYPLGADGGASRKDADNSDGGSDGGGDGGGGD